MAVWTNTVKTNRGMALDAKLAAQSLPLKIKSAKSGAGSVSPVLLKEQTEVMTPKQNLELKEAFLTGNTTVNLPVSLSNEDLETGYILYQVGIYAEDPDEGDILYIISQTSENDGETVPSEETMPGFSIDWNFAVAVNDASAVQVVISEAGRLTQEQADNRYAMKSTRLDVTLSSTGWSGSEYVLQNAAITSATQIIEMGVSEGITAEELDALQSANMISTGQSAGSITLKAMGVAPSIDIPVFFIVRRDL